MGVATARRLAEFSVCLLLTACGGGLAEPDGAAAANVLADGLVTSAEYRATIDGVVACLNAKGWQTRKPKLELDGVRLGVRFVLPDGSDATMAGSQSAWDECFGEQETKVERQYFKQHVPTGAARDVMMGKFLSCLEKVGVTGLTPASQEEVIVGAIAKQLPEDMSPGLLCLEKYSLLFPEGKVDS